METIDPRDLSVRLGDEELLVVDCRDEAEWVLELQIPGAFPMSVSELSEAAHILPDDELIVLCGLAPDGADARRAERLLRLRGREAVVLVGGLRAWISSGFPTERCERRLPLRREDRAAGGEASDACELVAG